MAAEIRFNYNEMRSAATKIRDLAQNGYKAAATAFESDFNGAIANWEGESHDKMVTFISGPVMDYMGTTVPSLLEALAQLLEDNAAQMEKADQEIADNIPQSLG